MAENIQNAGSELVSIIVPVYNVRNYLDRCMNSICNQTYKNIEIILVDDGSDDGSGELCDNWCKKDKRIKVLHKTNAGLAAARNSGIKKACGEWLCFIDSDDFISEDYVEIMHMATETHDTLLVQCRYEKGTNEFLPDNRSELIIKEHSLDEFYRYCDTTKGHSVYGSCINLYHKSVFEKVLFPLLNHTEDVPFVQEAVEFCSRKKLVTVNYIMYYYFQREGSVMHQKTNLKLLTQCRAYEMVLDFWEKHEKPYICEIFFWPYFHCLVNNYIVLRRDLPELREKYEFLANKIKDNLGHALRTSHSYILLPSIGFDLLKYLEGKRIILYGYGENGRNILPWLKYFHITPDEIWDAKADGSSIIDGIPFRRMHCFDVSEETIILITVHNVSTRYLIEQSLNDIGFLNIIYWDTIRYSIRRECYRSFLPFLIRGVGPDSNERG